MHALAQLLLRPAQLGLPLQQAAAADRFGQLWQLVAELGRDAGEFRPVRSRSHQHQIAEDSCQALQHGACIATTVQQGSGGFQQGYRFAAAHGRHQRQQFLFGHGT